MKEVTKQGKEISYDLEKINGAVFPALQGGPHENVIAGIAITVKQVSAAAGWLVCVCVCLSVQAATPQFRQYQERVVANARVLAASLTSLGYSIASGGTDIHLLLELR